MNTIVVPPLAGNFSAWGLLGADMVQSSARTRILDLNAANLAIADSLLAELFAGIGARGDASAGEAQRSARLDLRYKGQEHWLSIDVPLQDGRFALDADAVNDAFTAEYRRTFGGTMSEGVEIVSTRATIRIPLPRRGQNFTPAADRVPGSETYNAYSFGAKKRMDFRVVDRAAITTPLEGPAIVTESTATLYLDAGWIAKTGAIGELVLTRSEIH
jgi:N-methylhydantoinase A